MEMKVEQELSELTRSSYKKELLISMEVKQLQKQLLDLKILENQQRLKAAEDKRHAKNV